MKPHEQGLLNRTAKKAAPTLSRILAIPATQNALSLLEAYFGILLGKGAGTGWALAAEVRAIKSLIDHSAPVLFDVGANKGEWAKLFNQAFPSSRIYMFEPQPSCQETIRRKAISNSILIPKAVSASTGKINLYTPFAEAGIASLHMRRDSYFSAETFSEIEVETTTIDEIVREYGVERVDFMKMDVEGHELLALKGAQQSLKKGIIRAFSFEFGSGNINSRTFFHDFWDFLHPIGYRIFRILPSGRLLSIKQYYEDCEYFRGVTNYVAVRRSDDPAY